MLRLQHRGQGLSESAPDVCIPECNCGPRSKASRGRTWSRATVIGVLLVGTAHARAEDTLSHLQKLSLDQLANLDVTSVSKSSESLNRAPAAVYVITHEQIMRSGATRIPEILRLAPNLEVFEASPSRYIITARGLSGNDQAQNFTNKLLVLIDGRRVYNPLFSGMYWELQDIPREDIERIEVISGPGGTLYGANAVNGVINIITRHSADTQGGSIDIGFGTNAESASAQYGGAITDALTYRAYAKISRDRSFRSVSGKSADDGWYKPQGGFRLDWDAGGPDRLVLEGDIYKGAEDQPGQPNLAIDGGNVVGQWQHEFADGSQFQLLAYYDEVERLPSHHLGGFSLRTFDIEVQHNFTLASWNRIVWGIGERITPYTITPQLGAITSLYFLPARRTLNLADAFIEDRMSLQDNLQLTLGLKIEDDPFSHLAPMPSARIAWNVTDDTLLWAAVSRAIRSPTPFDTDVKEKLGPILYLTGNTRFLPETLVAYELGYRSRISDAVTLSVSGFVNRYDGLRTVEFGPTVIPLTWGNRLHGTIEGIEAWGTWQPAPWWQLNAGFDYLSEQLKFAPGASQILGVAQAGDDPRYQAHLRSSLNLGSGVTLDNDLRFIGALPKPHVPSYAEMNARLGWDVGNGLELSVSGLNLLHAHHQEFPAPADEIPRSAYFEARWKI